MNDEHGHAAGDRLLQLVAQRLEGVLRPVDRLARLGGDEFVVLAPPLAPAALGLVASQAQRVLAAPFTLAAAVVSISASIGTAGWVVGTTSVDEQLHRADAAMYAVKVRRPRAGPPVAADGAAALPAGPGCPAPSSS